MLQQQQLPTPGINTRHMCALSVSDVECLNFFFHRKFGAVFNVYKIDVAVALKP